MIETQNYEINKKETLWKIIEMLVRRRSGMTNSQWIRLFETAYNFPFRDDIRVDAWKKREFTDDERKFLLSRYSDESASRDSNHIEDIVQIFTRFFFKVAAQGGVFCPREKIELEFGKSIEENYGISQGPFLNLAKTYWSFRLALDEDGEKQGDNFGSNVPLFYMILRTVEVNVGGVFFPSGGNAEKHKQAQVLREFAPEIDIVQFISENPMFKTKTLGGEMHKAAKWLLDGLKDVGGWVVFLVVSYFGLMLLKLLTYWILTRVNG
jgi:hypothetical protein